MDRDDQKHPWTRPDDIGVPLQRSGHVPCLGYRSRAVTLQPKMGGAIDLGIRDRARARRVARRHCAACLTRRRSHRPAPQRRTEKRIELAKLCSAVLLRTSGLPLPPIWMLSVFNAWITTLDSVFWISAITPLPFGTRPGEAATAPFGTDEGSVGIR